VHAIANMRSSIQEEGLVKSRALQHIATSMLLCSFEIFLPSESTFQWPEYISGVKQIIKILSMDDVHFGHSFSALASWIYYHDVLALFSLIQWKRNSVESQNLLKYQRIALRHLIREPHIKVNIIFGCSLEMLDLLAEVFKFCDRPFESNILSLSDRNEFVALTMKLQAIQHDADFLEEQDRLYVEDIAELYRLTALIYLHRQLEHLTEIPGSVTSHLKDAFGILARIRTCKRAFPLCIIGCEARTDSQRKLILAVISNTQKEVTVRSYDCIRRFVESFWNLNDLDESGSTSYQKKMSLVVSSCNFLPTFI